MEFLAHISDDGRKQTVQEHLEGTARLCSEFAAEFDAAEQGYLAGISHDIGKYTEAFQRRLHGGPKVDHATAGAIECANAGSGQAAVCVIGITADCRTWVILEQTSPATLHFTDE